MTAAQGHDMEIVWGRDNGTGVLDYVTAWYRKAAEYIQNTSIVVGFVSTNSISQGEQVGALWNPLFQTYRLKILFAHRTFAWESEARGKAHVHVVIIGFAAFDTAGKRVFECHEGKVSVTPAKNISPYLIEGPDVAVASRGSPICDVPACQYGNKPTDGGFLIIEEEDRKEFLAENPDAKKYLSSVAMHRGISLLHSALVSLAGGCAGSGHSGHPRHQPPRGSGSQVPTCEQERCRHKKRPVSRRSSLRFGSRQAATSLFHDIRRKAVAIYRSATSSQTSFFTTVAPAFLTPPLTISAYFPQRCTWRG